MKKTNMFLKQTIYGAVTCALFTISAQAQEIPKAAEEAPKKEEFKPGGKVSGQVFGDFQYKAHTPDSLNLLQGKTQYAGNNGTTYTDNGHTIAVPNYPTKYSSFELRRLYLGYDYNFTEKFSAQVILSHEGNNYDAQGNRTILIK